MAFPISASATRSPIQSVISRSGCRKTRYFIRSPICRRHPRHLPLLAAPARPRCPLACRCNPIHPSSQRKMRSPCSRLLSRLHLRSHLRRRRCSARHCLLLHKASLLWLLHRCQPLAPLSPPVDQLSLRFLPPQRLQPPYLPSDSLSLAAGRHSLRFPLPQLFQLLYQPLAPLSLLAVQVSLRFRRPHHPPKLHRLQSHRHSSSLLRNCQRPLHRRLCNHSPERFNPSVPRGLPLWLNLWPLRVHLLPAPPNLSILLPPPPQAPCQPEQLRNQVLTAPNCSDRLPHRSSQRQLSPQRPRPRQPAACLPLRHLHPSCHQLPSLPSWKKSRLSPHLRPPHHSLPLVDCSTRKQCRCFLNQPPLSLGQNPRMLRLRPPHPQLRLRQLRRLLK